MKKIIVKTLALIVYHGAILLKGLIRMLYGVLMAALIAAGVYGFAMIPYETGYIAVYEFIASTFVLCIAFGGVYLMAGNCQKEAAK